jgi:hypothetical protein
MAETALSQPPPAPLPVAGEREAVIEECRIAARDAYNEIVNKFVMVGPAGIALAMLNGISVLSQKAKTGIAP